MLFFQANTFLHADIREYACHVTIQLCKGQGDSIVVLQDHEPRVCSEPI